MALKIAGTLAVPLALILKISLLLKTDFIHNVSNTNSSRITIITEILKTPEASLALG